MKTKILFFSFFLLLLFSGCQYDESSIALSPSSSEEPLNGERYEEIQENPFVLVEDEAISTFSIDADGAAYSNVRRFINDGSLPPKDAVRTEEMINFFPLEYLDPNDEHPIAISGEVSQCPWTPENKLIRIGLKGKSIAPSAYPNSNYVLLVDVSGSMSAEDKLPLLQESFDFLVDELTENDRISIVTYAGSSEIVLESTPCNKKSKIKKAIKKLKSGGGTAGAQGIITAYDIAQQNLIPGGNNRIIVATDGDFNIGASSDQELVALMEEKRNLGIFVTVLGVGTGNLNDAGLEKIADNGNGTYEYIDDLNQAKKVFIYEFGKFFTVAKDVKVQVEFHADLVESYRLIGYENRLLTTEEFTDDQKDAGEIGAGQNITALYEIVTKSEADFRLFPTFTIDFRYKMPDSDVSVPLTYDILDEGLSFENATRDMRFVSSVAGFSMLLRDSPYKGNTSYDKVLDWLEPCLAYDPHAHRILFSNLIRKARDL